MCPAWFLRRNAWVTCNHWKNGVLQLPYLGLCWWCLSVGIWWHGAILNRGKNTTPMWFRPFLQVRSMCCWLVSFFSPVGFSFQCTCWIDWFILSSLVSCSIASLHEIFLNIFGRSVSNCGQNMSASVWLQRRCAYSRPKSKMFNYCQVSIFCCSRIGSLGYSSIFASCHTIVSSSTSSWTANEWFFYISYTVWLGNLKISIFKWSF